MLEPFLSRLPDTLAANGVLAGLSILGLWWGAGRVIGAATALGVNHRVPDFVIGLTAVSIASSLPEIMVSVSAGWIGADDVAVGNIVGSCLVQITLILGVVALIAGRLSAQRQELMRDGTALLLAPAALLVLGADGVLTAPEGLILSVFYILYVVYMVRRKYHERGAGAPAEAPANSYHKGERRHGDGAALALLLFGGLFVWIMAETLVHSGIGAGEKLQLPQAVIGLWTGIGTSVPELAMSAVAAFRRRGGVSLGNLIGSNITDPFLSAGIAAMAASGLAVSGYMLFTAMPVWIFVTAIAVAILWSRGAISRPAGLLLVLLYAAASWVLLR